MVTLPLLFCPFRDTTTGCRPTGMAGAVHSTRVESMTLGWTQRQVPETHGVSEQQGQGSCPVPCVLQTTQLREAVTPLQEHPVHACGTHQ